MNLGLSLLFGLFLLAPGFGVYAGLFYTRRNGLFRPAPPAPASILTLAVVALGSLAAHAGLAAVIAGSTGVCDQAMRCAPLPFEPNIYRTMLLTSLLKAVPNPADVAAFLTFTLALAVGAFFATMMIAGSRMGQDLLSDLLYGWLADLVRKSTASNRYVTAFVLTKMGADGRFVGYEGLLENLSVNADKEIVSVTLTDCTAFLIKLGESSLRRIPIARNEPIARLYIAQAQVENIAFNVFES